MLYSIHRTLRLVHVAHASVLTALVATATPGDPAVTIFEEDPLPAVSFASGGGLHAEDAGQILVTVQLDLVSGVDVQVPFTVGGTALDPDDYTIDASPLVISAGSLSGDIAVTIVDDTAVEGAETVSIVMGVPTNATIGMIERHLAVIAPSDQLLYAKNARPPSALPVTPTPEAVDFSSTVVGASAGVVPVLVRNLTGSALTLTAADLVGRQSGVFSMNPLDPLPLALPHGGSTTIEVGFDPTYTGFVDATLRLQQTPFAVVPIEVPLTGVGLGPTSAEIAINAGGARLLDQNTQEPWVADHGFSGASAPIFNQSGQINAPSNVQLYRSARAGFFVYAFDLPNGPYDLTLHFAEIEKGGPGQRVFDVLAEGIPIIPALDVYVAAGGNKTAYVETHRVTVSDGVLDLIFRGLVDDALVSALEVRSMSIFQANPAAIDFGIISVGQQANQPLTLENQGLHPLTVSSMQMEIVSGDGTDFSVDIGGSIYQGSSVSVTHSLDLLLGGLESLVAQVGYDAQEHSYNELKLNFTGDFQGVVSVDVLGGAGFPGDPYLHPVLIVDDVVVDYDSTGSEDVFLDGADSHTHEPGKQIVAWEWRENANLISSLETDTVSFPIGVHTVELTIYDDNAPAHSLADVTSFEVFPVGAVPGVLALYYPALSPTTASDLLDAVPANPEFAEVFANLHVDNQSGIGSSSYQGDTMVRLQAGFDVPIGLGYDFQITGGVDHRIEVDGAPFSGPSFLSAGPHTIEVRWAVDTLVQLPLDVQVSINGGAFAPLDPAALTHDQLATPPVINSMPPQGISQGGNQIVITGFGFFPRDQLTVHWGNSDITETSFASWSGERIEFLSPPGTGFISVTVETPHGTSNAESFEYTSSGPIPVVFNDGPTSTFSNPTALNWGPDGRLYVVSRNGTLKAITYNEDYTVASSSTYQGVSNLFNDEVMGIAFNPYDPPSPVKVYVAHTEMYAQGGGSFSGPAPYPGQVSILTGPNFDNPVPLITQLPTSNHDHGINGLVFDNNGDLLICSGGNTNAGVTHPNIGDIPESPLSGAILKAELSLGGAFNGDLMYKETVSGLINNDQVFGEIVDVVPGRHVTVHVSGLRNTFDLALTTWGLLYCTDNGPNSGFGQASTGPNSQTSNHRSDPDEVNLVEYDHYYGHPNRNRGRYIPIENVYFDTGDPSEPGYTQQLQVLPGSQDGIFEYRADTFQGAMRGELLVQKWTDEATRVQLSPDKRSVVNTLTLPNQVNGLDIRQGPGGVIISTDYNANKVRTFIPNDVGVSGLTVYDVVPWRAPATGGAEFVIGGENFGTLGNTSVTFDGLQATLTSVTSKRIRGTVPAHASPTQSPVDIAVTVGASQVTHSSSFLFMPAQAGGWPGLWEAGPPMPVALGEVAGGVIDGVMYMVGETSSATVGYDLTSGTWSTSYAQRPNKGHHHSAEVYNGKLYLIGGLGSGSSGKVQIYDPGSDSWSQGTSMPWSAGSVCTARIGNKIYVAGGIESGATVDDCAVYDIDADSWTTLASMPFEKGRNHAATATDGQLVYIFGGRGVGSGSGNTVANGFDDVQIYDPATNTWSASFDPGSTIPPLPIGRGGTGKAVFYKGEFLVIGGETQNGPGAQPGNVYDRVDVFDPVSQTWRLEARLPTPRHGIFPVLYQGKVYVVGGGVNSGFSNSDVLEVFSRQ